MKYYIIYITIIIIITQQRRRREKQILDMTLSSETTGWRHRATTAAVRPILAQDRPRSDALNVTPQVCVWDLDLP